uniref:Peptidase S1 domain-containing protein n=1 Tax=Panagrolaimus sp. ES5 TaxID=591445 RepID=A0AC34GWL4_9BILA
MPFVGQCGATIISKRHLLTAAHCIVNVVNVAGSKDIKFIRRGDYFLADLRLINDIDDNNFHSYNVSNRTYIHHNYNFDKFTNDIAVVEYPKGFDFGIQPIRLAADFVENEGEMAFAVGYGKYQPNDSENLTHSYFLREGVFVFRETEYCSQTWTKPDIERKICSGEYGRGTALGDSGGPLMKNGDDGKWYQVGICSYGKRNSHFDRKTHPGWF